MSLFGRIVGRAVGAAVGGVVANKVGHAISDQINKAADASGTTSWAPTVVGYDIQGQPIYGPPSSVSASRAVGVPTESWRPAPGTYEPQKDKAWFRNVLATDFAGYMVREGVSPAEFGGDPRARAYDFVVYAGGVPKAAIVFPTNNRSGAFRTARQAAQSAGIAFLPFWLAMWNTHGYVVNRIRAALL